MSVDITVANAHHSGYGASASPADEFTFAVRLARSALLTVRAPAATADGPSLCALKNSQLQPALSTRFTPRAAVYPDTDAGSCVRSLSMVAAEVTAISV